jgi:hypothetical protein
VRLVCLRAPVLRQLPPVYELSVQAMDYDELRDGPEVAYW